MWKAIAVLAVLMWLWFGFLVGLIGLEFHISGKVFLKLMLVSFACFLSPRIRDWVMAE